MKNKICIENPSKSGVIGRCGEDEKSEWPRRTDKVERKKKRKKTKLNKVWQSFLKLLFFYRIYLLNEHDVGFSPLFWQMKMKPNRRHCNSYFNFESEIGLHSFFSHTYSSFFSIHGIRNMLLKFLSLPQKCIKHLH